MNGLLPVAFMIKLPMPHSALSKLSDPNTMAIMAITVTEVGRSFCGGK
jgi:hypothetical protein